VEPVRVFSCFDRRHDVDLHARLVALADGADSPLRIVDASCDVEAVSGWEESLRSRIGGVDVVIVSCGEHTDTSLGVSAELRIAQEQNKPYVLLRGRRHAAWTQPASARAQDLVYTWDWPLILSRVGVALRRVGSPA
jgi:hypothetical protein